MATVLATEVGLENKQGKIRLRLPRAIANGSSRYISTGLDYTPENQKKAQVVAWAIEDDIRNNSLDPTLERYKQQFRPQQKITQKQQEIDLLSLWQKYAEYKRPQLAPTTYERCYKRKYTNHIRKLPSHKLTDAVAIRDHLLATLNADAAKRVLTHLSACCAWATKSKLILSNPFVGMAADIRKPKNIREIQPFTTEERDNILEAFAQQKPHYSAFVSFLFLTGCRTGEAIGLRWVNVAEDCSYVVFCESFDTGFKVRKCTKTGESRRFPCNQQLQTLLLSLDRGSPDSPVFTSPSGSLVNASKFTFQIWQPLVEKLVLTGKVRAYRSTYNTRHTFISLCLEAGIPIVTVAKWVGNSPEVIMRHYAGVTREIGVPEL